MTRWGWIVAAALGAVLLVAVALGFLWFGWDWKALIGWRALVDYINPKNATGRKDAVQVYALIAAGLVAAITAAVGLLNLRLTRRNLEQQRELEDQRAEQQRELEYQRAHGQRMIGEQRVQQDALQSYLEQITQLVHEGLRNEAPLSPLRELVRGRTVALFWQLDQIRKRALLQTLHEAGLIRNEEYPIIGLSGADLSGAYLRELNLKETKLDGADLKGADLSKACLRGADLGGADLGVYDRTEKAAELTDADLSNANLTHAKVTKVQLGSCRSLAGATMPDVQNYEDWIKDKEGSGKDVEND
jgi:hypothetical protein